MFLPPREFSTMSNSVLTPVAAPNEEPRLDEAVESISPQTSKQALRQARREVRLKEAQWHRKRAEVARLIAAGEEAAADKLLGLSPTESNQSDSLRQNSSPAIQPRKSATKKPIAKPLQKTSDSSGLDIQEKPKAVQPKVKAVAKQKSKSNGSGFKSPVSNRKQIKPTVVKAKKINRKTEPKKVTAKVRSKSRRTTLGRLINGWSLWLSKRPAWAVSLTLHSALMIFLMLATFATFQEDAFVLTASLTDGEEWADEMPEISLVNWEVETESLEIETELETLSIEPVLEPILEPVNLPVEDPLDGALLDSLPTGASLLSEVPAGAASPVNENGKANGKETGEGERADASNNNASSTSPTGKVSFFGVRERADRVVFVVDNSGSMQRGRMETTLNELNRAVQSLSPHQSYYVIFYSDQAYPMFFPQSVEELQPATRDSKRQFSKWLRTIEICLGGRLLDAIEMAASLEPQVVFLMSDGDIRSQRVMQSLTQADEWPFTIHSFGMEVRTKKHAENLAAISNANEGEFRVVDVRPKAIRQSMVRPITYHRQPGDVWGSKVQVW